MRSMSMELVDKPVATNAPLAATCRRAWPLLDDGADLPNKSRLGENESPEPAMSPNASKSPTWGEAPSLNVRLNCGEPDGTAEFTRFPVKGEIMSGPDTDPFTCHWLSPSRSMVMSWLTACESFVLF